MQEATEIAKLRLFLTMVASVRRVEELEPLPNIDFNILPGNSLVGLMRVDEHEFERKQDDLFKTPFRKLLEDKNRKLETYRHTADLMGRDVNLRSLRDDIDQAMKEATGTLNELLRDQFEALGVKYEQATWDAAKNSLGKPKKIKVARVHIDEQTPFHWGYMFDQIMQKQGGFDIILTNPPWEAFKPFAREFFAQHSKLVTKKKMDDKAFEELKDQLLQTGVIRADWLDYASRFPHLSAYFRASDDYSNQWAIVDGKRTGSDLDLYKLFVERVFNLLRPGGHSGLVIPAGIYMALGATGLRNMLFQKTEIEGMVGFTNNKEIFEGVHRSIKFVVLTYEKLPATRLLEKGESNASAPPNDLLAPGIHGTQRFPAVFMQQDATELAKFPDENALWFEVDLIKKLSPESHSMMEFKSEIDLIIVQKLLQYPLLGDVVSNVWSLTLGSEFHMTMDKELFKPPEDGRLRLYEGKMMWQFDSHYADPTRWVDESEGREALIGKRAEDAGQVLGYQQHRLAFRSAGENTNERNLIATILPKNVFCGNSLTVSREFSGSQQQLLFVCAVFNSYVLDWLLRLKIQRNLNMFLIYQLPVPRLNELDPRFAPIASRAARLICTTPEFDDLAKEVGLKRHQPLEPLERARLRAELDGLIAHLYGLTEAEFAHILTTFPLVAEPVKVAALNAYRDVGKGLVR